MKKKLQAEKFLANIFHINKKQKDWLVKEAKKWECSQSQIIRSLIRSKISVDNKEL